LISLILRELWSVIALRLTDMEDYSENTTWEQALGTKLFMIVVPVTIFPAIHVAFLQKVLQRKCAPSFAILAEQLVGVKNATESSVVIKALRNLEALPDKVGEVCITGCFPTSCQYGEASLQKRLEPAAMNQDPAATLRCDAMSLGSNCMDLLHCYLWVYLTLFALVHICKNIAVLWSTDHVGAMLKSVISPGSLPPTHAELVADMPSWENHPSIVRKYTKSLLQNIGKPSNMQKRQATPGVNYTKSFVDFIELFAMIICFGAVMPGLVWTGGIIFLVLYRIKMHALIHLMHRPYPTGRESTGHFETYIFSVTVLAVIVNAASFCFLLSPMRYSLVWSQQVLMWVFLEHGVLVTCIAIQFLFCHEPLDVDRINHENQKMVIKIMGREHHKHDTLSCDSPQELSGFDVGVHALKETDDLWSKTVAEPESPGGLRRRICVG